MTSKLQKQHVVGIIGGAALLAVALFLGTGNAPAGAQIASQCVPAPAGLVSWWPGDGNANDIQGVNHGTLQNGATFAAGQVGQAFSLDGVDDYVNVPSSANLNPNQFTVDVWVNPAAGMSGWNTLASKYSQSTVGWTLERIAIAGVYDGINNYPVGGIYFYVQGPNGVSMVPTSTVLQPGTWYHITGTYDGTVARIYVNGILENTGNSLAVGNMVNAHPLQIGRRDDGSTPTWKGLVDEVEIFNRALSAAEIQSIYNAGSAGKCKQVQVSCGNGVVEGTEQCDDGNIVSGDGCSSACQLEDITSPTCAIISPTLGSTFPAGLVSWWPGDGNANDIQGVNHGTLQNGATFAAGQVGQAFSLDGVDDHVLIPTSSGLDFSINPFAIAFWLKTTDTVSGERYFLTKGHNNGQDFWAFARNRGAAPDKLTFQLCTSNSCDTMHSTSAVNDGAWHYIAVSRSGNTIALYVDGTAEASMSTTRSATFTGSLAIGALLPPAGFGGYVRESVDEFEIFNRALTSTEIQSIYNAGSAGMCKPEAACVAAPTNLVSWWPGDNNPNDIQDGNAGTLQNGATFAAGQVGQAFSLDGVDDYFRIPISSNLQSVSSALTVDLWVKPNSFANQPNLITNHVQNFGSPVSGIAAWINNGGFAPSGTVTFQTRLGNTCCQTLTSNAAIPVGQWSHIAFVWDGTALKIYINGVLDNSLVTSGTLQMNRDLFLGINADNFFGGQITNQYSGLMDEIKIFNRALTVAEIQSIFNAGSAGMCVAPVAPVTFVTQSLRFDSVNRRFTDTGRLSVLEGNVGNVKLTVRRDSPIGAVIETVTVQTLTTPVNGIYVATLDASPIDWPSKVYVTVESSSINEKVGEVRTYELPTDKPSTSGEKPKIPVGENNGLEAMTILESVFLGGTIPAPATQNVGRLTFYDDSEAQVQFCKESNMAMVYEGTKGWTTRLCGAAHCDSVIIKNATEAKPTIVRSNATIEQVGTSDACVVGTMYKYVANAPPNATFITPFGISWRNLGLSTRIEVGMADDIALESVILRIQDINGNPVKEFPAQPLSGQSATAIFSWDGIVNGALAADGVYKAKADVRDNFGRVTQVTSPPIVVDKIAPNVAITEPPENGLTDQNVGISMSDDFPVPPPDTVLPLPPPPPPGSVGDDSGLFIDESLVYGVGVPPVPGAPSSTLLRIGHVDPDTGKLVTDEIIENSDCRSPCTIMSILLNGQPAQIKSQTQNLDGTATVVFVGPKGKDVTGTVNAFGTLVRLQGINFYALKSASVSHQWPKLPPGEYAYTFKVEDSAGNQTTEVRHFTAVEALATVNPDGSMSGSTGDSTTTLAPTSGTFDPSAQFGTNSYDTGMGTDITANGSGTESGKLAVETIFRLPAPLSVTYEAKLMPALLSANTVYMIGQKNMETGLYDVKAGEEVRNADGSRTYRFSGLTVKNGDKVAVMAMADVDGDGLTAVIGNMKQRTGDECPVTFGRAEYNGCPFADKTNVTLHIVDQQKSGVCGLKPDGKPRGECKQPLAGAVVKVFDREDPNFIAAYGSKRPSKTVLNVIYDADLAKVGSCTTDNLGSCLAGEDHPGKFLVIAKYVDGTKSVYVGKFKHFKKGVAKAFEEEEDDDDVGDVAPTKTLLEKNLRILKTIKKDGTVTYHAGKMTVVSGSRLDTTHPEYTVWSGTQELYPFIFASADTWNVDVCLQVPAGYKIAAVEDGDGNILPTNACVQSFIAGETKIILFSVTDIGSPEPSFAMTLAAEHNGKKTERKLTVEGIRKEAKAAIDTPLKEKALKLKAAKETRDAKAKAAKNGERKIRLTKIGASLWSIIRDAFGLEGREAEIVTMGKRVAKLNAIRVPEWGIAEGMYDAGALPWGFELDLGGGGSLRISS